MALLSTQMFVGPRGALPMSLNSCRAHSTSREARFAATSSASAVDSATLVCNFDLHNIGPPAYLSNIPLIDLRVTTHDA